MVLLAFQVSVLSDIPSKIIINDSFLQNKISHITKQTILTCKYLFFAYGESNNHYINIFKLQIMSNTTGKVGVALICLRLLRMRHEYTKVLEIGEESSNIFKMRYYNTILKKLATKTKLSRL